MNSKNKKNLKNKEEAKNLFESKVDFEKNKENSDKNAMPENSLEGDINTNQLEEEVIKLKEEKLRLLAEMENIRKRAEKEKIESIKFGSSQLARDILSPNDNLVRALENIPKETTMSEPINNLIEGLKMVQKEFNTILKKHGINKIEALNKKFDHNLHQAMLEVETNEKDEGIVVQEIQTGYTMHERLLRPSMVGVAKKLKKNKEK